ncbi:MAG: stage V sporulation protein AE [Oscillospiraceae bacterium]|jgi:stage V sporulation protein AE|nr:stage V sporulation protein AE [Oscillospiraceae bacterium]
MEICAEYLRVFLTGGLLCLIGQILIEKTGLTPARILSSYVVAGVILGAAGVYKPLVEWGGAGATIPLTGFGYALSEGMRKAVDQRGAVGIFTGGLTAAAAGVSAAVIFGFIFSLISKPDGK